MYRRNGLTLIELTATVAAISLSVITLQSVFTNARARARVLKDSTQAKGIHQAWVVKSIDYPNTSPPNTLPTPGIVNRRGNIVGRGEEDMTKNDHASLFSMSIAQNLLSAPMCVSCVEASPKVKVCTTYDATQYKPAEDMFWDGDRAGEGPFGPDSPGNFKANLSKTGHVSFATMPLTIETEADPKDSKHRRKTTWRKDGLDSIAVLGNRGVCDGVDGSVPGTDVEIYRRSVTLKMHGGDKAWEGNVVFGDNHVTYVNSFWLRHCVPVTDPKARVSRETQKCEGDLGVDNVFREDDTRSGSDAWICVAPWLVMKDKTPTVPSDHALLYD